MKANVKALQYWLEADENRKPAELAFTDSPERQMAYHIEHMMQRRKDGVGFITLPTKTKLQCPRCRSSFYD